MITIFGHHSDVDGLQFLWDVRPQRTEHGNRCVAVGQQAGHHRVGRVRCFAGQQKIQRAAQAVDVGSMVGRAGVHGLLRSHVVHRAHHAARVGQSLIVVPGRRTHPRETHVEDPHDSLLIQQQVARLDVPMHDPLLVGASQSAGRLADDIDRIRNRQRSLLPDARGKVFAVHVPHHQIEAAVVECPRVVGRDDVLVFEQRRRLNLAFEPLPDFFRLGVGGQDEFDRDLVVHLSVPGLQHIAHTAATDLIDDLVIPDYQRRVAFAKNRLGLIARDDGRFRQVFCQLLVCQSWRNGIANCGDGIPSQS